MGSGLPLCVQPRLAAPRRGRHALLRILTAAAIRYLIPPQISVDRQQTRRRECIGHHERMVSPLQSCPVSYSMKRVAQMSSQIDLTLVPLASKFRIQIDIVIHTSVLCCKSSSAALQRSLRGIAMMNVRNPGARRSHAPWSVDDSDRGTSGRPDGPKVCVVVV